jgi:uncharacterized protein (DUF488 family)
MPGDPVSFVLLTIGHSNRPIDEFLHMLESHGVERLVDVRTFPHSRHNPQFNQDALAQSLRAAAIDYRHMPALGGLRRPRPDSPNSGWRNPHFRGYADHMQSPEFQQAIRELLQIAAQKTTTVMCAEAVPWRCHRSLIADTAVAHGVPVLHIMSPAKADPHKLTSFARIDGTTVQYPAETLDLFPST